MKDPETPFLTAIQHPESAQTVFIPLTNRFLCLRLRLEFTKRRLERIEASYYSQQQRDNLNQLFELQASFATLRREISRIEQGQENLRQRAQPKVECLLQLHHSFCTFVCGFYDDRSPLSVLNRGNETCTGIQTLIADFAGVPHGLVFDDLKCLAKLLEKEDDEKICFQFRKRVPKTEATTTTTTKWRRRRQAAVQHDVS